MLLSRHGITAADEATFERISNAIKVCIDKGSLYVPSKQDKSTFNRYIESPALIPKSKIAYVMFWIVLFHYNLICLPQALCSEVYQHMHLKYTRIMHHEYAENVLFYGILITAISSLWSYIVVLDWLLLVLSVVALIVLDMVFVQWLVLAKPTINQDSTTNAKEEELIALVRNICESNKLNDSYIEIIVKDVLDMWNEHDSPDRILDNFIPTLDELQPWKDLQSKELVNERRRLASPDNTVISFSRKSSTGRQGPQTRSGRSGSPARTNSRSSR